MLIAVPARPFRHNSDIGIPGIAFSDFRRKTPTRSVAVGNYCIFINLYTRLSVCLPSEAISSEIVDIGNNRNVYDDDNNNNNNNMDHLLACFSIKSLVNTPLLHSHFWSMTSFLPASKYCHKTDPLCPPSCRDQ